MLEPLYTAILILGTVCSGTQDGCVGTASKMLASDGTTGDQFGSAISVQQGLAIIGSLSDTHSGVQSGSAYLFDISDPYRPIEVSKVAPTDGADSDLFGGSVAIDMGFVIIGSHLNDEGGSNVGSVYIYDVRDPANPEQVSKLLPSDNSQHATFGYPVSTDDGLLVVGARWDRGLSGSTYVYDVSDPANPVEMSMLVPSEGISHRLFGLSNAIEGDLAIIGSRYFTGDGNTMGTVYLYDLSDPRHPAELSQLTPSDISDRDYFGDSLAMDGNIVLVGSWGDDDAGQDSGSVYIFDISDPVKPLEIGKIVADDGAPGERFGSSISIAGGIAAVGAYVTNNGELVSGSTYVFDVSDPTRPSQLAKLVQKDRVVNSFFDSSVFLDEDVVIVGARHNDDFGEQSGSAYLYELSDINTCDGDVDFDGVVDPNDISYVLFRLGGEKCDGDSNRDGTVDVNDISYVLFRLGDPCP